jgi:hypothetical protein
MLDVNEKICLNEKTKQQKLVSSDRSQNVQWQITKRNEDTKKELGITYRNTIIKTSSK